MDCSISVSKHCRPASRVHWRTLPSCGAKGAFPDNRDIDIYCLSISHCLSHFLHLSSSPSVFFVPGSEAGLLLLPRSFLSSCLALHVARLPGCQLCALSGCKVNTLHHTPYRLSAAHVWALLILLNTSPCHRLKFLTLYNLPYGLTGTEWLIGRGHYCDAVCLHGFTVPVFFHQIKPLRVVQPSPVPARAQRHAGESVHARKQPVVPCWRLHAAGIRDNAQSLVHQMC